MARNNVDAVGSTKGNLGQTVVDLQFGLDENLHGKISRNYETAKRFRQTLSSVIHPVCFKLAQAKAKHGSSGGPYDLSHMADLLGQLEEAYHEFSLSIGEGSLRPFETGDLEQLSSDKFEEISAAAEQLQHILTSEISEISQLIALLTQTHLMITNIIRKSEETYIRGMERSVEKSIPR